MQKVDTVDNHILFIRVLTSEKLKLVVIIVNLFYKIIDDLMNSMLFKYILSIRINIVRFWNRWTIVNVIILGI
jgi:hypothetical protein